MKSLNWLKPKQRSTAVHEATVEGDTLYIRYTDGGKVYPYPGAADMLDGLLTAESPGAFINRHLRGWQSRE